MRILLDTCTFLWIAQGSSELSAAARDRFEDPANENFLSVVSAWEIAVKHARGKLILAKPPEEFVPAVRRDYEVGSLPLGEGATLRIRALPRIHKDPFDRMLVCQALEHELTILTPDPAIRQYAVRTLW